MERRKFWQSVGFGGHQTIPRNRDVATYRVGPPDLDAPAGADAERHFERLVAVYLEHPDLGVRMPFSFGQDALGPGVFWLA